MLGDLGIAGIPPDASRERRQSCATMTGTTM
jgi:hypothetical protein